MELLKKFYALEFTENLHDTRVGLFRSDRHATDIQHSTLRFLGDHYEVGLLWKQDDMMLLNNGTMALTCLNRLRKRLLSEPELLEKYQAYIQKMIDCGQAVMDKVDSVMSPRIWYRL